MSGAINWIWFAVTSKQSMIIKRVAAGFGSWLAFVCLGRFSPGCYCDGLARLNHCQKFCRQLAFRTYRSHNGSRLAA